MPLTYQIDKMLVVDGALTCKKHPLAGKSVTMTFSGITGTDCGQLNTAFSYDFADDPQCNLAVNGEVYDPDYCITICSGTMRGIPEWTFGIGSSSLVVGVAYEFSTGCFSSAGNSVMNFRTTDADAICELLHNGSLVLPFFSQGPFMCCNGSGGHVTVTIV